MGRQPENMSALRRFAYNIGSGGFSILDNLFGIYFIFFLLPPLESGLPERVSNAPLFLGLTLTGLIVAFGRIIDSVSDPLIAYWSDSSRSKLGRRRFFLVTGALPFALVCFLLFTPPMAGASGLNAAYEFLLLGLYFFLYTYYIAPYLALIPELSRTHGQRISMTAQQALFSLLGAVVVMMGVPALWDAMAARGDGQGSSAFLIAVGASAALSLAFMLAPVFAVDERRFSAGKPSAVPFFESIRRTISNKPFMTYILSNMMFFFAFNVIRATVAYYPVVLLGRPQSFQTLLMAALFGSAALWFVGIGVLSSRVDNKRLMASGLLCFAVLLNLSMVIGRVGDAGLALAFVQMALLGYPVAVLLVIPNAMVADLGEADALATGQRREAMFFGAQGFFMKVNLGLAAVIVSSLFSAFGKDASRPLGVELSGPIGAALAGGAVSEREARA